MKKIWFIGILVLPFWLSCSSSKDGKQDEKGVATVLPDSPNEVRVFTLTYSDFNRELISNGTIAATQKADLYFQTSETIAAIYVKNGDRVAAGQAIASLDSFKLKNRLNQARDNLERTKLDLQDVLIGQGYSLNDSARIPGDVMQIARIRSNYGNSANLYELANYELKNATLYAPFSGTVANLFQKKHNLSSPGEPFCSIIGNTSMEVVFPILESELAAVGIGNRILVSPFALSDFSSEGRITEINPTVDRGGMIRVKASVSNSDNRLYDGMNVRVIIQQVVPNQLAIPKEALVLRTNKQVVFTYKDGRAQWNYVHTGLENSTHYVILEGTSETLREGDVVIYEGNLNLAHETPVVVLNEMFDNPLHEINSTPDATKQEDPEPVTAPVAEPTLTTTTTERTTRPAPSQLTTPATPQTATSSTTDNVLASVKVQAGQRLTLIAEEYYGNKVFWVYLYEYNKAKIGSNPDRIPIGMEIIVPAKEVYGIDANSASSVEIAMALQRRNHEVALNN